jgi:DNA-binding NarL/FixJ family response regulator
VIRIVLADDQALVRAGMRMVLHSAGDMTVVAEAEDGDQAVRLTAEHAPDIVLMDIRMPRRDGLEATRAILAGERGDTRVLMLTTFDTDEYVYRALRAGASGFLLKTAPPERLIDAVRCVCDGEALLAPSITRRLIEEYLRRPPASSGRERLDALTDREREVLGLIGRGRSNAEIAATLVIADATVKTHVNRIIAKLGVRDRAQAVMIAYETGLVAPGQREADGGQNEN